MAPDRRRRGLLVAAIGAALVAVLVHPVAATPVSDKQAEAARIAERLDTLNDRISVLGERYNQARLREEDAQTALVATTARLQVSDAQLAQARQRLEGVAVATYIHGGSASLIGVLLRGDNVGDLNTRRRYVQTALDDRHQAVRDVAVAQRELTATKAALVAEEEAAHAAAADAAASRSTADVTIASQQRTLSRVQGEMADLVKAEQARRAAEDQRLAEARVAQMAAAAAATTTTTGPRTAASPNSPTTTTTKPLLGVGATTTTTNPSATQQPAPLTSPPPSARASAAVEEAKRQLGKPYVFGGSGPDSFDCSGLVAWAWRAAGVSLPHSAGTQYRNYPKVPLDALQPGDIVVFGSDLHHNGIYVGGGQMIHAPQTGDVVKYSTIYRRDLYGATRPST